jgi:uncharacterized membrane protein (Fun14 family)
MTPDGVASFSRVPGRTRLYVLLLRALGVLIALAVLAGFAFQDRVVGWLPHTTAFAVVFACVVVALLVWADVITGNWDKEKAVYARALRRFASWLRRDG